MSAEQMIWQALRAETRESSTQAFLDAAATLTQRRLWAALHSDGATPADIAPLIRQLMRREAESSPESFALWTVRKQSRFPNRETWQRCGIEVIGESADSWTLRSHPWHPNWIPHLHGAAPERDAVLMTPRRPVDAIPADPFLAFTGFDEYRSTGQRQAIRAVVAAPPGSTLIVNLPTGAGKSLCAHLLACVPELHAGNGSPSDRVGLTVCVVPTNALALDQERTLTLKLDARFFGIPLAYVGAGGDAQRELKNAAIRDRIREGKQPIIFVSPESVIGALRPALYRAATQGSLQALVIDEAHIVEQWGEEFRSSFQELSGLRRSLLRTAAEASFPLMRTLLLSATLTESALETLTALYGEPGPCRMVSAAQLRPEPDYYVAKCEHEAERAQRVLEALAHLPRPLILYVTKREDAKRWCKLLREEGYRRLDMMTGETPTDEREHIIQRWTNQETDLVVATSAFGLGMDQSEVRTIVHACLPETLDRLYQEVGRGGRDGNASISIIVYTQTDSSVRWRNDDVEIARALGRRRIITVERGLQRWQALFAAATPLVDGRFAVSLDTTPGTGERDIDMDGTGSQEWNARTLTLLSRAGVIRLDDEPPSAPDPAATDSEKNSNQATKDHGLRRVVEILRHDHLDAKLWEGCIEAERERSLNSQNEQWKALLNFVAGRKCAADALARAYAVTLPELTQCESALPVAKACAGCPHCRTNNIHRYTENVMVSDWTWPASRRLAPAAADLLGNADAAAIFNPGQGSHSQREDTQRRLLRWLLDCGVQLVVAPRPLLDSFVKWEPERMRRGVFIETEFDRQTAPRVPGVYFAPHDSALPDLSYWQQRLSRSSANRAPMFLVMPDTVTDPERPERRLVDILKNVWSQNLLEQRYGF